MPPLAAYTGLFERNDEFVAKYSGDGGLSIPVIPKRMMIFVQTLRREITIGRLFVVPHGGRDTLSALVSSDIVVRHKIAGIGD